MFWKFSFVVAAVAAIWCISWHYRYAWSWSVCICSSHFVRSVISAIKLLNCVTRICWKPNVGMLHFSGLNFLGHEIIQGFFKLIFRRCSATGGIRRPVCETPADRTVLARAFNGACSGCQLSAEANPGTNIFYCTLNYPNCTLFAP